MFRLLIIMVMLSFLSVPTINAAEIQILPEDEAVSDLDLVAFREQLQKAVVQKDANAFMALVAEDVAVKVKKTGGLKSFKKAWDPESESSELWPVMNQILSMGGGFLRSERGVKFCAPYTFVDFPSHLDIYAHGIVIKDNVPFKATPSKYARTLKNLSYNVVQVADWRSVGDQNDDKIRWLKVKTLAGEEGYVKKNVIRSPADYSACFLHRSSTGWKLISLISND